MAAAIGIRFLIAVSSRAANFGRFHQVSVNVFSGQSGQGTGIAGRIDTFKILLATMSIWKQASCH
jgi:hypothetical protein